MRINPANCQIWVLCDERSGNSSQTLGVAEALGIPFVIKNVKYSFAAKLPNKIMGGSPKIIDFERSDDITSNLPDVLISAGRKLASASIYLKKLKPSIVNIHMMNPEIAFDNFDLIAIPAHDKLDTKSYERDNVVVTFGSPNRITEKAIKENLDYWKEELSGLGENIIALLVGGDTKYKKFTKDHALKLMDLVNRLASRSKAAVVVTTSRRTSPKVLDIIKNNIRVPNYIHEFAPEKQQKNIYPAILGISKSIIVTADSISMCSESCSTGKPVFIFNEKGFLSQKHSLFISELLGHNFASLLDYNSSIDDFIAYNPLRESEKIAKIIKERFFVND